ncbi:hypothetical protein BLNAU_24522 [Blattamonas nauphoetae]|uniref:Uncharacterized protein n=1 Tax=Blattamonas nauphoetae TaxID=2049346 RepID=A0ABQ9WM65_9EUKA|nr:hypothetical protein BLNAU_24522 [Blattamonas nauphoetae]
MMEMELEPPQLNFSNQDSSIFLKWDGQRPPSISATSPIFLSLVKLVEGRYPFDDELEEKAVLFLNFVFPKQFPRRDYSIVPPALERKIFRTNLFGGCIEDLGLLVSFEISKVDQGISRLNHSF